MPKSLCLIVFALGFPGSVVGQTAQLSCSATALGDTVGQLDSVRRTGLGTAYSLMATVKTEVKLPDGNIISGFLTSRQARDSEGRTRVDQPMICATDEHDQPKWQGSMTITDPVARTILRWVSLSNSMDKTANVTHETSMPTPRLMTGQMEYRMAKLTSDLRDRRRAKDRRPTEEVNVEDLGQRSISGLGASGMRVTRTVPAGTQGNSLPLAYVEEKWVSDAYGMVLLDIKDDPFFGKSTYEVTSFTAGEPDASLFQVPAGYTIKELP
jgi:hypothetical protein